MSEPNVQITNFEQLRRAQRLNKAKQTAVMGRLNDSFRALQGSLTVGNILLSAIGGGAGLLRSVAFFRRAYRMMQNVFQMFTHRKM